MEETQYTKLDNDSFLYTIAKKSINLSSNSSCFSRIKALCCCQKKSFAIQHHVENQELVEIQCDNKLHLEKFQERMDQKNSELVKTKERMNHHIDTSDKINSELVHTKEKVET